jgi:cellulose synthase A
MFRHGWICSGEEGDRGGPRPPESLSDKLPLPPADLNLYRAAVALRLLLLAAFFRYRVAHPARGAPWLWLAALACELCLALAWLLAQLPKLSPTSRETHLDKDDGEPPSRSRLGSVDVLVTAAGAGAGAEPPLAAANTVLSVLAADYPTRRLAC